MDLLTKVAAEASAAPMPPAAAPPSSTPKPVVTAEENKATFVPLEPKHVVAPM